MNNPPITWARFIMLVEAEGVKADDMISALAVSPLELEQNRRVNVFRDSEGKVQIY